MKRTTFFLILVLVFAVIFLLSYFNEPVQEVLFSFDVEPVDTPEMVSFITSTLDQYGANATFFVTGEFAQQHPRLVRDLAKRYEVACHTMTHPRLPEINSSQLRWELATCKELLENLTNTTIVGFRAPYNLIDERSFALLKALNYSYDASTFENLGWFYPPPNMTELPTNMLGPLPLEDYPLVYVLRLGDFAFFLFREDHDARVNLDLHPRFVYQYRGAFQYLISSYADDGVRFLTYREASQEDAEKRRKSSE